MNYDIFYSLCFTLPLGIVLCYIAVISTKEEKTMNNYGIKGWFIFPYESIINYIDNKKKIIKKSSVRYNSVEELMKSLDNDKKEALKTIKGFYEYNIYYPIYRLIGRIEQFFRWDIKTFIQRGKRGWGDRDTWSFDWYLSDVISQGVRHLEKHHYGHPCDLSDENWKKILNKIATTFETSGKIADMDIILTTNKKQYNKLISAGCKGVYTPEQTKEYYKGFDLFKKYFLSLWD